jgi:hypothetical protein
VLASSCLRKSSPYWPFSWMSTFNLDVYIEKIIGFGSNIHSVSEEGKLFVAPSPHLYTSSCVSSDLSSHSAEGRPYRHIVH